MKSKIIEILESEATPWTLHSGEKEFRMSPEQLIKAAEEIEKENLKLLDYMIKEIFEKIDDIQDQLLKNFKS